MAPPTAHQWLTLKPLIYNLYITQNQTAASVSSLIAMHHGFTASERAYKAKFKEWRFKKNFRTHEVLAGAEGVNKRRARWHRKKAATVGVPVDMGAAARRKRGNRESTATSSSYDGTDTNSIWSNDSVTGVSGLVVVREGDNVVAVCEKVETIPHRAHPRPVKRSCTGESVEKDLHCTISRSSRTTRKGRQCKSMDLVRPTSPTTDSDSRSLAESLGAMSIVKSLSESHRKRRYSLSTSRSLLNNLARRLSQRMPGSTDISRQGSKISLTAAASLLARTLSRKLSAMSGLSFLSSASAAARAFPSEEEDRVMRDDDIFGPSPSTEEAMEYQNWLREEQQGVEEWEDMEPGEGIRWLDGCKLCGLVSVKMSVDEFLEHCVVVHGAEVEGEMVEEAQAVIGIEELPVMGIEEHSDVAVLGLGGVQ